MNRVASIIVPGSIREEIEAGLLRGDEPCDCGETTVEECDDCCDPKPEAPGCVVCGGDCSALYPYFHDARCANLRPAPIAQKEEAR